MYLRVVDPGSHGNTLLASECLALFTSLLGGRVGLCNSDTNYNVYVFFSTPPSNSPHLEGVVQFKSSLTTISPDIGSDPQVLQESRLTPTSAATTSQVVTCASDQRL